MKKLSAVALSLSLAFGTFLSVGHAETPSEDSSDRIKIQVQSVEKSISKETFIKKLNTLFPKQFDFLTSDDFHLSNGHYYPDDERTRYELSFNKTVKGKHLYGYIEFVGEDLEIEHFYFEPLNTSDALFPAKVSKEEAEKIAINLLKRMAIDKEYELHQEMLGYPYYSNQTILEPVRYEFSFVRKKDGVPLVDQQVHVTVLGSGDVVSLYRYTQEAKNVTYDDTNKVKKESDLLRKFKNNLDVSLTYQVNYDYQTGEEYISLVYNPTIQYGIHAISGEWQTANGFTKNVPKEAKIEKLVNKALPAKHENISVEEALEIAENLLQIDSDNVNLRIHSIEEMDYMFGQPVLNIHYSYEFGNGSYGSSLLMNKETGEIISYHDLKRDVLRENGESLDKNKEKLSEKEALAKAMDYLKEWIPSYLHHYAKPMTEPYYWKPEGVYHFTFPRVVNGILVQGHSINVSIGSDGSLYSLDVHHQENVEFPALDNVISKAEAKNKLKKDVSLKLQYMRQGDLSKENHYHLVYTPVFNGHEYNFLDAITGEWNSELQQKDLPEVSHPTAEAELNYLIQSRILEIKDASSFKADSAVINGEALKILVKSLSYFYEYERYGERYAEETDTTMDPDDPYYSVVERAVQLGILNPDEKFHSDEKLTREQLAVWYVRTLGLEMAAKNYNIYILSFDDAKNVQDKYKGYVALANSLDLLSVDNKQFKPKQEVTYADIAESIFKLAHAVHENGRGYYMYY